MDQCRRVTERGPGSVSFLPRTMIVDAVTDGDQVCGAWGIDLTDDQPVTIATSAVVLATGGAGDLFKLNVFP